MAVTWIPPWRIPAVGASPRSWFRWSPARARALPAVAIRLTRPTAPGSSWFSGLGSGGHARRVACACYNEPWQSRPEICSRQACGDRSASRPRAGARDAVQAALEVAQGMVLGPSEELDAALEGHAVAGGHP